jgi:hypothetical protein
LIISWTRHSVIIVPVDGQQASELVTIRQFGNMSEALLAKGCLESAGIECFLTDVNITRLEWPLSRGMRLQVRQDDAASAIEVLDESGKTVT